MNQTDYVRAGTGTVVSGDFVGTSTSATFTHTAPLSAEEQESCEHCFHYSMTQYAMCGGHNEHCCHCGYSHWRFDDNTSGADTSGHGKFYSRN